MLPSLQVQRILRKGTQQCLAIGLGHAPCRVDVDFGHLAATPPCCWLMVSPQRLTDDSAVQCFPSKGQRASQWRKALSRLDVYDGGQVPTPPMLVHSNALLGWAMGHPMAQPLYACHLHEAANVPSRLRGVAAINVENAFVVLGCEKHLHDMETNWQDAASIPSPLLHWQQQAH